MNYLTAARMREADRRAIQDLGIPGAVLMNAAGTAVFNEIEKGPVGIVCGKGNNGGDGFVVARLCQAVGLSPFVVLLGDPSDVKGDAALFRGIYERLGGIVECAPDPRAAEDAVSGLAECAVLVDAMLGTGTKGEVVGAYRKAIEAWPEVPTIAVDLPSGMNADTGQPCGCCVKADTTVTFQFPKAGFEAECAAAYMGRLVVADIGIPPVCADDNAWERLSAGFSGAAS